MRPPAPSRRPLAGVPVRALLALAAGAASSCAPPPRLSPSDAPRVLAQHVLEAPDPGRRGPFAVRMLIYGSGTDRNRAAYRDSVAFRTRTVDASKLVDLGESAEERNGYWGFGPEAMPLNARVWYPEGEGPFPLVLVVHGNHDMKDFSDPGYDYLGELLASRGFILASIDENFLNGSIREENDARGWFLLEHLAAFERFDREPGNPFEGKVDMSRIALIGHSRGGEAVANAAAFNRLTHYPDDATLTFDYGFDIRGIVSIAPVDGQYLPTGRKVVVEDVSYLTFHGSHDGDVTSFHGLRIYDRLRFTDPEAFHFKSAIYVYRANHGQWNTVWGAHDGGPRSGRFLDLRPLIAPEEQRRFAEIYVSAFLETVLRDDRRYLPIFRDHRVIGDWLPRTMYVTRFETSAFRPLAGYEEDIDVTSGTEHGVRIRGEGLASWRETELLLRSSNRTSTSASQENQAVLVGWNRRGGAPSDAAPRYVIELPPELGAGWGLDGDHTLDLLLAPTRTVPDSPGGGGGGTRTTGDARRGAEAREAAGDSLPPMDLTVEVVDAAGRSARVALGRYGPIRRPLETWVLRRRDEERERFQNPWELILQTYSIPLRDFTALEPALDLRRLAEIRFVFDRTEAGEVAIDQVGLSDLEPGFLSARVEGPGG